MTLPAVLAALLLSGWAYAAPPAGELEESFRRQGAQPKVGELDGTWLARRFEPWGIHGPRPSRGEQLLVFRSGISYDQWAPRGAQADSIDVFSVAGLNMRGEREMIGPISAEAKEGSLRFTFLYGYNKPADAYACRLLPQRRVLCRVETKGAGVLDTAYLELAAP